MGFWADIKRRKVYSVGSAYLIVGWIVLQVSNVVLPALSAPPWVFTLIVIMAVIGFPVALVMAWAFEIGPEGIQVDHGGDDAEPLERALRRWVKSGALRGVAAGALAVVAVVVGVGLVQRQSLAAGPLDSLVVLPLVNLSGDTAEDYFSDGMTDALISNLGKIDSLRVISRTSAMHYRGSKKAPSRIADDLGVKAALEGTVFRTDDERVRVNVSLIDARSDRQVWSESYVRNARHILALQSDVAREVADELRMVLSPEDEARFGENAPLDTAVFNPYLRGRYYWWKRTPAALRRALESFQLAVVRSDSLFAPAFSGIADAYGLLGCCGYDVLPPTEAMPKAERAARAALKLDSRLAEAHTSMAWVALNFQWDWERAEAELKQALASNPGYTTARMWLSGLYGVLGRSDEAIEWARLALESDPISLIVNANLGLQYSDARRYDDAVAQLDRTLSLDPDFPIALLWRAKAKIADSRFEEGLADAESYAKLAGHQPLSLGYMGYAAARSGDRVRALGIAEQLRQLAVSTYVSSYPLAVVYTGLGLPDEALESLERAFVERSDFLIYLGVDPVFDSLRSNPRFQALVKRVGLPLD